MHVCIKVSIQLFLLRVNGWEGSKSFYRFSSEHVQLTSQHVAHTAATDKTEKVECPGAASSACPVTDDNWAIIGPQRRERGALCEEH